MLAALGRPDRAARRHPVAPYAETAALRAELQAANAALREGQAGAEARRDAANAALVAAGRAGLRAVLARVLDTDAPLRERLVWFWADHFTVAAAGPTGRAAVPAFVDEAIRPHVTGRFADMLRAVIRHPVMLVYLDQHLSYGPGSAAAARGGRGLNENLARELLELHTLGVGGGYAQADVRAAAELLTGLMIDRDRAFVFRPAAAEPGAETVLGRRYGGDGPARIEDIDAFLGDLAAHPATARHLARKLAVHFVADDPPAALVEDLAAVYAAQGGDLMAVTGALVTHPLALAPTLAKVKPPLEFVASALVAGGVTAAEVAALEPGEVRRLLDVPLTHMGQPFQRPRGPDGWPEAPGDWITPQGLAARIGWATALAGRLVDRLGDPRGFLDAMLPGLAGPDLRFAVGAAETRREAVALVLASAEFNRR
ncbi:DUF1800 domain-containing protein [Roseibacterium sp. KMU-115]|uniref:DUF1800 domain-containing protein n=2 Tax=Roseicyclus persicicus TaxID=2650661 RepID=A0A7X6GYI4_9RHOB|nr:DUF1800 domain-containing protein [Roseibacterium persicicum]